VQALDAANNASAQSSAATATTLAIPDTSAPTTPTGLTAIAVSTSQINLSWNASTDNVGVSGYRIYRNDTFIATLGNATTYENTGLTESKPYTYRVDAMDAAGNASGLSAPATATTLSGTLPTVSLSTNPTSVASGEASTLTWSSTSATSCTASGDWSGTRATSGSESTGPLTASSSYSINCTGTGGSASASATVTVSSQSGLFPLQVEPGKRYLVDASGNPFLIHGDTAWTIANQLSESEIDVYLNDRRNKGFNTVLVEIPGFFYTSQTPHTNNVDGVAPFTTMSPVNWASLNNTYWNRVDYFINGAKSRNMAVIFNPAYMGTASGDGWLSALNAESDADLRSYGAALANRYTQGNIIWCLGGDISPSTSEKNKQWNIVTGIRSVRTTDLITAHPAPPASAYDVWSGFTGLNLNAAYPYDLQPVYDMCLTEYNRAGPVPVFMLEARYEQEVGGPGDLLRQTYQALLSGCVAGQIFGNNPIWHFESPNTIYGYGGTWESNLNSTGSTQQQYVRTLFNAYPWHLLEPRTDNSLVSTALGAGNSRIAPARASDGSFAFIWSPDANFTVNLGTMSPSSVRARWYDPANGTYSAAGGPFANSGTQAFNPPGTRLLVLDAAP
jgi:chitodextrinase